MKTCGKNEAGFTLIELMIVIVMIGVLASIGLQYVEKSIDKTRVNSDIAQGHIIKQSLDMFYAQKGRMPSTMTEVVDAGLLKPVSTAQKYSGNSIQLDDANYNSNPILKIDLAYGRVQVMDVTMGSNTLVWDSGSN